MTKGEVTKELRRLQSEGHSMRMTEFDSALYQGIREHFGGYVNAKKALGIRAKRRDGSGGRNKRPLYDVISELRSAYPMIKTKNDYIQKCNRIYKYSRDHLGGPYVIFEEAGLAVPSDTKIKPTVWTEEAIKRTIQEFSNKHGTVSSAAFLREGYSGLVKAVKRQYGTWNAGLVALGYEVAYEYHNPDENLTKEETRAKVVAALASGTPPTRTALEKEIEGLKRSITVNFGGIDKLKEYCGFCAVSDMPSKDVDEVRKYRPKLTTAAGVRREILRMWYIGSPMNYAYAKDSRRHVLNAVNKYIGSWRKAVESIGLDYDDISRQVTTNRLSECGVEFEETFSEILTELGYEFLREGEGVSEVVPDFTLKPDFILPNWRWIDCKLSEWTDIRETIIRYHKGNPNGITIVYLRGKNRQVERGRKWKYEHVSVYQFTKLLPKDRREYYEDLLRKIEEKANEGAVAI